MTKAALFFPLTFIFLLAAIIAAPAQNQNSATTTAVNEAVMRQADTILLRQKIEAARTAVAQKDLVAAAKLYEDAYTLVQQIGSGINAETTQTISGLVSVRMELAREAQRAGDVHEADAQVSRVLKIEPQNPEALAFKKQNDQLIAQMRGKTPDLATQEEVPAIINQKTDADTLARDGQMLYEMGKLEEAEVKLTQAIKLDPDNRGAYYYLSLVKQASYAREEHHKNVDDDNRMVEVERAWESPVHRDLLPTPNPYATTNFVHTGPGREAIYSKLDRIRLETVSYKGLPLSEVIRDLTQQSRLRDPDKKGINFLFNPNTENISSTGTATPATGGGGAPGQPTVINPATGLPETSSSAAPELADPSSININLTLNDVRLADVLDAICLVADHPIKYSVEDYAVVFSAKGPESPQYEMRTFKVDPNTFYSGLQNVGAFVFGSANLQSGSGGGSGGGSSGGGGGNSQSINGAVVPVVDVAPGGGGLRQSGSGGGGGGAGGGGGGNALVNTPFENSGGGVLYVTSPNQTRDVSSAAKLFFTSLGVDLTPPKALFFNDRLGLLFVYAAPQDLDIIERAIQALNEVPPQVHIKARFIDVEEDDAKALGFDWYLGQFNIGGGVVGQGGNAGSVNVPVSAANPSGYFPGNSVDGTIPGTVQSLTSGLTGNSSIPAIGTITGILTNPNFQVVLHALETRSGTQELAEPEVTTISGRQTQMRATQILTIITGFNFQQGSSTTSTSGTGTP